MRIGALAGVGDRAMHGMRRAEPRAILKNLQIGTPGLSGIVTTGPEKRQRRRFPENHVVGVAAAQLDVGRFDHLYDRRRQTKRRRAENENPSRDEGEAEQETHMTPANRHFCPTTLQL